MPLPISTIQDPHPLDVIYVVHKYWHFVIGVRKHYCTLGLVLELE